MLGTLPHAHGGTMSGLQPWAHCRTCMGGPLYQGQHHTRAGGQVPGSLSHLHGGSIEPRALHHPTCAGGQRQDHLRFGVCPGFPATPAVGSAVPRSPPDPAGVTAARALGAGGHSRGHRHARMGGARAIVTTAHLRGVHPSAGSPQPPLEGSERWPRAAAPCAALSRPDLRLGRALSPGSQQAFPSSILDSAPRHHVLGAGSPGGPGRATPAQRGTSHGGAGECAAPAPRPRGSSAGLRAHARGPRGGQGGSPRPAASPAVPHGGCGILSGRDGARRGLLHPCGAARAGLCCSRAGRGARAGPPKFVGSAWRPPPREGTGLP